jgi:glycosyltransferase involved in cell wall biosynthesis
MRKIDNHLVLYFDILIYPPVLSLIETLLDMGFKVTLYGYCSNTKNIEYLIYKGLKFLNIISHDNSDKSVKKFFNLNKFKNQVLLKLRKVHENDYVWFLGNETVVLFTKEIKKFNSIVYFFEIPYLTIPIKYRLWTSDNEYKQQIKNARRVINCEPNRALVVKFFFGLSDEQIVTIPNKTNFKIDLKPSSTPEILSIQRLLQNKKVIIYQGGINYPERRLEELCESINFLNEEYIIAILTPDSEYKNKLVQQYASDKVLFLPFIKAPHHLHITKLAKIGFLTYFPITGNIEQILNVLYCAPNKVFEYAQFGIPMLSNELPALDYIYNQFNCGKSVRALEPKMLAEAIIKIDENYDFYSKRSKEFFESVNLEKIITKEIFGKISYNN